MTDIKCNVCNATGNKIKVGDIERMNGHIGHRYSCLECGNVWGVWHIDNNEDGTKGLFDNAAKE